VKEGGRRHQTYHFKSELLYLGILLIRGAELIEVCHRDNSKIAGSLMILVAGGTRLILYRFECAKKVER
jgi:hypothetical protein